jgi:hypothetical protein
MVQYVITGTDARGKRFKPIYAANLAIARAYNIYRGTLWAVSDVTGKRTRVLRWYNSHLSQMDAITYFSSKEFLEDYKLLRRRQQIILRNYVDGQIGINVDILLEELG